MEALRGLTQNETDVIRAVESLTRWKDVCGLGREAIGRDLTKQEAWEVGRRVASAWCDLTGLSHPSYAMMPKRSKDNESSAHLKAVYPPSWFDRVKNIIRDTVEGRSVANGFVAYPRTEDPIDPLYGSPLFEMIGGSK
jgi:hypothetical protein